MMAEAWDTFFKRYPWQRMQGAYSTDLLFLAESYFGRIVWYLLLGWMARDGCSGLEAWVRCWSRQQRDHSGICRRRLAWCLPFSPVCCAIPISVSFQWDLQRGLITAEHITSGMPLDHLKLVAFFLCPWIPHRDGIFQLGSYKSYGLADLVVGKHMCLALKIHVLWMKGWEIHFTKMYSRHFKYMTSTIALRFALVWRSWRTGISAIWLVSNTRADMNA